MSEGAGEAARLESLWAGPFGDRYMDRNRGAGVGREAFWNRVLGQYPCRNALEVGCNIGANLEWIAARLGARETYGVEINEGAVEEARRRIPGVAVLWGPARDLPFRDRRFDLVFTTGVLIHQPPAVLPVVMAEIVRCSNRYVLCGEYYASEPTEVPYRGESGALFKRDFGRLYQELFPELTLLESGFLPKDEGPWDDVSLWVFEKSR